MQEEEEEGKTWLGWVTRRRKKGGGGGGGGETHSTSTISTPRRTLLPDHNLSLIKHFTIGKSCKEETAAARLARCRWRLR